MGKYGITGDSGMVADGLHVAGSYDCNGMVFVEKGDWWKKVKKEDADESKIIKCSQCEKPAVSLDHYWPYSSKMCLCADHYGKDV